MPTRDGPQPLGQVLEAVIDRLGLRTRIDEARIVETWAMLAGPQINAATQTAWIKGRTLYVKVISSAWRQELHLCRRQWKRPLNKELGDDLADETVFR